MLDADFSLCAEARVSDQRRVVAMTEATPRPWAIGSQIGHEIDINCMRDGKFRGWFLRLSPGYTFEDFPASDEVQAEFLANAALIVRAVNSHDALVDALVDAYEFIGDQYGDAESQALDGEYVSRDARPVWNVICTALAAAKEGAA
jgi:hypothetical protein